MNRITGFIAVCKVCGSLYLPETTEEVKCLIDDDEFCPNCNA